MAYKWFYKLFKLITYVRMKQFISNSLIYNYVFYNNK